MLLLLGGRKVKFSSVAGGGARGQAAAAARGGLRGARRALPLHRAAHRLPQA